MGHGNMPMDQMDRDHMMQDQIVTTLPAPSDSLKNAQPMTIIDIDDGDTIELSADIVKNTIQNKEVVMYGYNGQIPGPILRAKLNATYTVKFTNNIDHETTVHWHGLRHDNKDDGVPDITQEVVRPGETFTYTVRYPDEGMFWYHPHVREDMQQDLGLAGNLWATGKDPAVNREEVIIFDDIRMDDNGIVPYGKDQANFAIMGRFGNVMLINGQDWYGNSIWKGEVVRFYLTNVANTRPFRIAFKGAHMKLVGGDIGYLDKQRMVDYVTLFPGERKILDVHFKDQGSYPLVHITPDHEYGLGSIMVADQQADSDHVRSFQNMEAHGEVKADINRYKEFFKNEPDHEIDLTVKMPDMGHMMDMMHGDEGIEWEDTMPMMNAQSSSEVVKWILRDRNTKKENMDIVLKAKVGDVIKIRFNNDPHSDHPMQHPMHLHGQRFLVLNPDGTPVDDLVWKDTAIVPTGKTVDLLVDVTNPGKWMMHCHIGEHLTSGMMAMLEVQE